jgi:hypothetical protein
MGPILSHIFRPWMTLAAQTPNLLALRYCHCWARSGVLLAQEVDQMLPVVAEVIPVPHIHSTTSFVPPDVRKSSFIGVKVGVELLCPLIDAGNSVDKLIELCNGRFTSLAHASNTSAAWLAEFERVSVIASPIKCCIDAFGQLCKGHSGWHTNDAGHGAWT